MSEGIPTAEADAAQRVCPSCHAAIPVDPGYVSWCDRCGWNVQPQQPAPPRTRVETLYAALGRRFGASLFAQVTRSASLEPRWTASKLAAFILAGIVHGLTLLFAISGIALVVGNWPHPILVAIGLLCIATAWLLRPRVGKMPSPTARREDFPALYKAVDSVTGALGSHTVAAIVLTDAFNASFAQVGWRRRRVLSLGVPLFTVLSGEERIALLAHEVAHGVNGDPNRGFVVGTALNSLSTWQYLLRPNRFVETRYGRSGLGITAAIGNAVSFVLSGIPWAAMRLLSQLLYRDAQRAEYLADHLATRAGGTAALLGLLDKLHLSGLFAGTVQNASTAVTGGARQDIFDELARRVAALPEREWERIRRVERLADSRLDATHPPTASRIAFLQTHPAAAPAVTLSRIENEQIEAELRRVHGGLQARLLDTYRRSLYY